MVLTMRLAVAIGLAVVSCAAPRPAPTAIAPPPPSPSPSPKREQAPPEVARPAVATAVELAISSYGPAGDPYNPPLPEWAPRKPLQMVRVECAPDDSAKARRAAVETPVVPGAAPVQPPMVCRAGWRRPLGANLATNISTFGTANEELARLTACYPLRDAVASRRLLDAIAHAMFPGSGDGGAHDFEPALIAASRGQPTVIAVHSLERVAVYEHCQGNDCFMDPHYHPRFIRFDDVEQLQLIAADGRSTRQLYVPANARPVTLKILDDGSAGDLVAAARAARWTEAERLAAHKVDDTRQGPALANGLALANLAVVLTFTRDRARLRETIDAFRALHLGTDRTDAAAATTSVNQADEFATGMVWLGADPCRPPKS